MPIARMVHVAPGISHTHISAHAGQVHENERAVDAEFEACCSDLQRDYSQVLAESIANSCSST